MKKALLLCFLALYSCKDDYTDNNTFLPNVQVNFTINLNLPEGNALLTNGFKIFYNKGLRGVIVFNNGLDNYIGFDLACPHINLQDCSTMTFDQSDLYMSCPCDEEKFSKLNGAPKNGGVLHAAREYIVTKSSNLLTVRN